MDPTIESEIVGTAGLTVAGGIALLLCSRRILRVASDADWHRTRALFGLGLAFQAAHFAEEYLTEFYHRYPTILGLVPWSSNFFLAFNLFWLVVWVWAAFALRKGSRLAFFLVWFFSLAATVNGIAHPLLAVRVGGYFPGLLTSPFLGIIGIWLFVHLIAISEPRRSGKS